MYAPIDGAREGVFATAIAAQGRVIHEEITEEITRKYSAAPGYYASIR
jgi:hypothetical protein